MKIAFIADPLDRFKIYKDTTYAMMAEAGAARPCAAMRSSSSDLALEGGRWWRTCAQSTLTGDADDWYRAERAGSGCR